MKLRMPTGSELQYNSISVHSTRCVCAKTTISLQPEPDVPYSAKPTEVPTQTTPLPANCKPQHQAITNHQNPGSVCPPCQMHDEQQPAIACRETLCCPGLDRSMSDPSLTLYWFQRSSMAQCSADCCCCQYHSDLVSLGLIKRTSEKVRAAPAHTMR